MTVKEFCISSQEQSNQFDLLKHRPALNKEILIFSNLTASKGPKII